VDGLREYQEALKLGRLLVEAGFDVCSGGYAGIMEAISRGPTKQRQRDRRHHGAIQICS
jgi:predicted Rossmann-fold nucleotide-binding protein